MTTTYVLQLTDQVSSIDFIGDSNYYYLDGTFDAPTPTPDVTMSPANYYLGERVVGKTYKTRTVSFSCLVRGSSTAEALEYVTSIHKMIERASMDHVVSGSFYAKGLTTETGAEVGDTGLLLRVQLKNTIGEDRLTFKVLYGTVSYGDLLSETGVKAVDSSGNSVLREVNIELVCSPYAIGPSTLVQEAAPLIFPGKPFADQVLGSKISIAGSQVKGDAPAPIKVNFSRSVSDSMILARESGASVLNGSAPPFFEGSGLNDMFTLGIPTGLAVNTAMVIMISAVDTINKFSYSLDGGATYYEDTPGHAEEIEITGAVQDVSGMKIRFGSTGGHTLWDKWHVVNHQRFIYASNSKVAATTETYTPADASSIGSVGGGKIGEFKLNIPWGTSGKYLLFSYHTDNAGADGTEFAFTTESYNPIYGIYVDRGDKKRWVRTVREIGVPLGMIDLSRSSHPASQQPLSSQIINVNIWARRVDPSDVSTIIMRGFYLVPCEGSGSWGVVTSFVPFNPATSYGEWFVSNYDMEYPYVMFSNAGGSAEGDVSIDATGQILGSIPTLVPGVAQELTVIRGNGAFTDDTDYRKFNPMWSEFSADLWYRPRYLVVA